MKAVIDGASNQLNLTTTLMTLSAIMLGLVIVSTETDGIPVLIALSTEALLSA